MSNIIVGLVEHYRTACISAIIKRDKQNVEKYLNILLVLHRPTYLVLKSMLNKKE